MSDHDELIKRLRVLAKMNAGSFEATAFIKAAAAIEALVAERDALRDAHAHATRMQRETEDRAVENNRRAAAAEAALKDAVQALDFYAEADHYDSGLYTLNAMLEDKGATARGVLAAIRARKEDQP